MTTNQKIKFNYQAGRSEIAPEADADAEICEAESAWSAESEAAREQAEIESALREQAARDAAWSAARESEAARSIQGWSGQGERMAAPSALPPRAARSAELEFRILQFPGQGFQVNIRERGQKSRLWKFSTYEQSEAAIRAYYQAVEFERLELMRAEIAGRDARDAALGAARR